MKISGTALKVLSSYERGIIGGMKESERDKMVESQRTQAILNNMIKARVKHKLDDGTEITASVEELIIASAIQDAIDKGSMEKLMTFMKAKGEIKANESLDVNISKVDKDLEERAL